MALLCEVILSGWIARGARREEEQGCGRLGWGEPNQSASTEKADLGRLSHVPHVARYWLITLFNPQRDPRKGALLFPFYREANEFQLLNVHLRPASKRRQ